MKTYVILLAAFFALALGVVACEKKPTAQPATNTPSTGDDDDDSGSSGNTVVVQPYGRLFATVGTIDGGFAWTGNVPGDLTLIADPLCATEATGLSLTGTYKALLNLPLARTKTIGWVLKKSAQYRRPDGTVIGTTNASGYFDFPLTASIAPVQTTVWTGMNSTFDSSAPTNCSGFSDGTAGSFGVIGDAGAVTSAAVDYMQAFCSNTHNLVCAEMIPRTTTVPAQAAYRRIFPSTVALVAATGIINENSVTRFDQQCQTDANTKGISNEGYTTYKALIVTNTTNAAVTRRMACLTANCGAGPGEAIGWVLEPNTEYRRENGTTVIGTTNANAIFDFPLTNSLTGVNEEYWTGQNPSWATVTNGPTINCTFYQTNSSGSVSNVGVGDAVDTNSISSGTVACDQTRKILCVEQKRTQTVWVDYPGYD